MKAAAEPRPVIRNRALTAAIIPVVSVVVLLATWLLDRGLELGLARFGLYPRSMHGLVGILTAPLLHDDWDHLFNNSTAIVALGWCLMYFYPRIAGKVVLFTWLLGGVGVWLMGRANFHIGASGVIYGMAAFLFVSGMLRRQRTLMALSLLVTFLYGSLIWGILPIMDHVSWESHLWGGVAGIALAFIYRHVPPAVSDPRPAFADEEEDEQDDDTGLQSPLTGDPGDEVNEAELVRKRRLAQRAERPGNVSTTWDE
ncbi:MAG: rhomboid family intramembrane serine protease [Flavobacteriales bacterium]|nr:rhomboid family intramembrane serine protease [Flavobacteriales bacterium]